MGWIIKLTSHPCWEFFNTLGSVLIGIVATWKFAYYYYKKAQLDSREVNAILFAELRDLKGLPAYIEYDSKGRPFKVAYGTVQVSGGGNVTVSGYKSSEEP